jgi:hypothetical protein
MISDRTLKWRSSLPASGGIIRLGGEGRPDEQVLLALSRRLGRPTRRRRGVVAAVSSALMGALRRGARLASWLALGWPWGT